MAFTIQNWARASVSANEPIVSVTDTAVSGSPVIEGCFREYNYYSPVDTQATVAASGYFNLGIPNHGVYFDLVVGDLIKVYSLTENSIVTYIVTSIAAGVITVAILGATERFTLTLTAAQFIAAFATPVVIAPAPGANFMYADVSAQVLYTFGTAAFTLGGNIGIQYGSTANLAGPRATSVLTAAAFDAIAATSIFALIPAALAPTAAASVANQGLFLSNDTATFTLGTGAVLRINVSAKIVPLA